jgi:polyhydroxyalkanoate synthesis regulator phasin
MSCVGIENVVHPLAKVGGGVGNMTEETKRVVLEMLRRIRASPERTEVDVADIKVRMSALAQREGKVLPHQGVTLLGTLNQRMDRFDPRMDRFDERLGRIEHRLDAAEA